MPDNSSDILKRQMPYNIDAEKAVIGSMLMDKEAIEAALPLLSKEDFYSRSYALMFDTIVGMYNENIDVDLVTIRDQLIKAGAPAQMQSLDFLRDIFEFNSVSVNIRSYARIVRQKSILRKLIKACGDITTRCYEDSDNTEDILSEAEHQIFDVLKTGVSTEMVGIDEISQTVFSSIQEASLSKSHVTGLSTGFADLDYITTGFQDSDFILIAARPSMGKTAFALNILEHVGIKKNEPCMIFSLEMSKEQLVNRLFAMDSGIDMQSLRSGRIEDEDWDRLVETAERVGNSNIIIDDTPAITAAALRTKCRKVKLEKGLKLIIIDYLQLMSGSGVRHNDNRQQEISDISRALKALARDVGCPVIALSQLSRAVEARQDKHPMLSDLRESGAMEQDADIVMFLYRDEYYHPDTQKKGEAEVIISKQRNGPTGSISLYWQAKTARFVSQEKKFD